jgi:hypothetical protein
MDEESARQASTGDTELYLTAVDSLAKLFCVEIAHIKQQISGYRFFNWQSGAYSYGKQGYAGARKMLADPIEGTIFFVGEAFQDKVAGATVEAAFVSAEEAVKRL